MNGSGVSKGCSNPYDVIGAEIWGSSLTLSKVPSWVDPYETKGKYGGKPAGSLLSFEDGGGGSNMPGGSTGINEFAKFGADPVSGDGSPLNSETHTIVVKWCQVAHADAEGGPYICVGTAGNMTNTGLIQDDQFIVHDLKSTDTKLFAVNNSAGLQLAGNSANGSTNAGYEFKATHNPKYLGISKRFFVWYVWNNKSSGTKTWKIVLFPVENGDTEEGWIPQWAPGDPTTGGFNHISTHSFNAGLAIRQTMTHCRNDCRYSLELDTYHPGGTAVNAELYLVGPKEALAEPDDCVPCTSDIDVSIPLGPAYLPGSVLGDDHVWSEMFERRDDHFAGMIWRGGDNTGTDYAWSTRHLEDDGSLKWMPIPAEISANYLHIDSNHDLVVAGTYGMAKLTGQTWTHAIDQDAITARKDTASVNNKIVYTHPVAQIITSAGCCGGEPVYHVRGILDLTPDYKFRYIRDYHTGYSNPTWIPSWGNVAVSWVVSSDGQTWSPCRHEAPDNTDGYDDTRLMTPVWFDVSDATKHNDPAKGINGTAVDYNLFGAAYYYGGVQMWGGPASPASCSCGQSITEEI